MDAFEDVAELRAVEPLDAEVVDVPGLANC